MLAFLGFRWDWFASCFGVSCVCFLLSFADLFVWYRQTAVFPCSLLHSLDYQIMVRHSRTVFLISAGKGLTHLGSVDVQPPQNPHSYQAVHAMQNTSPSSTLFSLHDGREKLRCPKCSMPYLTPTMLTRHLNRCTGINPLMCRICKRMFSQACAVKEHMRGFHGIGEKVFCQYCGKVFKYKTSLYTHFCEEKRKQRQQEEKPSD